jgi:hypothetical protein
LFTSREDDTATRSEVTGTNGGDKRKAGEDDDKRKTRETTQTLKEGLSLKRQQQQPDYRLPRRR